MSNSFTLLGKSSYAIAIISDILKTKFDIHEITIVSNIADAENDSLQYEFVTEGIKYIETTPQDFHPLYEDHLIIASIGKSRKTIFEYFNERFTLSAHQFIALIHPTAVLADSVQFGHGLHVSPLSVIAPFTKIGNFVVVNRNASIGHHSVIHDYVTINPGVNVAGCCTIGENAIIGAGTTILDKIKIGKNTIIGAGSVVTKDVPDGVVAYGSPAKIIRSITS